MDNDVALFEALAPTRQALLDSIGKVVVGQHDVVDMMLTALFANGHCLFVGVPGLAKTTAVRTLARALLDGRRHATPHDVKRVALDVLRHRMVVSYEAEADGVGPDAVVAAILASVETP